MPRFKIGDRVTLDPEYAKKCCEPYCSHEPGHIYTVVREYEHSIIIDDDGNNGRIYMGSWNICSPHLHLVPDEIIQLEFDISTLL